MRLISTMDAHDGNVVRSCFYQLRQLRGVQKSLTTDARRSLVTAFVSSRLDYCNGILKGVAAGTIHRLQLVLHAAARLVVGARKYDHITPVIRDDLHCLHVPQRISYKIALLAQDYLYELGPAYFIGSCVPVATNTIRFTLRSAQRGDMIVPRTRTELGRRSFRVAAPTVWNSLPPYLRQPDVSRNQFRTGLKTHLFQTSYTPTSENN